MATESYVVFLSVSSRLLAISAAMPWRPDLRVVVYVAEKVKRIETIAKMTNIESTVSIREKPPVFTPGLKYAKKGLFLRKGIK